MTLPVFNFCKLSGAARGHHAAWRALCSLAQRHAETDARVRATPTAGTELISAHHDSPDDLARAMEREVQVGIDVYNHQMFVVLTSLTERALRHFFACLFVKEPQRMNDVARNGDDGPGRVLLNDVIAAPDKEALMRKLAKDCARRVTDGRKPKVIKKLADVDDGKRVITETLQTEVLSLIEARNVIVHGQRGRAPTKEAIDEGFASHFRLLEALADLARSKGIDVDDWSRCMLSLDEEFYGDVDDDPSNMEVMREHPLNRTLAVSVES